MVLSVFHQRQAFVCGAVIFTLFIIIYWDGSLHDKPTATIERPNFRILLSNSTKHETSIVEAEVLPITEAEVQSSTSTSTLTATQRSVFTGNESCSQILQIANPPFPAMLLDIDFMKSVEEDKCKIPEKPLKIAVSIERINEINRSDHPAYEILFYETSSAKNYIKFFGNITRAIPHMPLKEIENWRIPEDAKLFSEYWRRSQLIDCLGIRMNRTDIGSKLPIMDTLDYVTRLRKLLVSLGIFPFIGEGTLLGWYRECGIIPHTHDMDIFVLIEEHNPKLLELLQTNKTDFRLKRKFGRPNDTYEFTLVPQGFGQPVIDIFFMYNNGKNESWVGGTGADGQKYQFYFPLYDPYCAADIHGHLFWITCRPHEMLEFEYGKEYKKDHLSKHYSWHGSQKNSRKSTKWNSAEMKEIYFIYF